MIPTRANGQPAVAEYEIGDDGTYRARAIHVLGVTGGKVARIVVFFDPTLFPLFDLPAAVDAGTAPAQGGRP
jgi:RNA polymerase sigma-70 factor (ECF subfamily)